jgi:hypothetical protein
MIDKIIKTCGWAIWIGLMALGYGIGWKVCWEMFISTWNFVAWTGFDWIIFGAGLIVAHSVYALLVSLGPKAIQRKVTIKNAKQDN